MRLTETDASFVYMETASSPMHISSVYVLDGELSFDQLMTRFEKRIHLIPAYRRKLMQVPFSLGHPVWVDDKDFDLRNRRSYAQILPIAALLVGLFSVPEVLLVLAVWWVAARLYHREQLAASS